MYRFYITFIFLCVTHFAGSLSAQNSSFCAKADSLFEEKNYRLACVEYERCFYLTSSQEQSYYALKQKSLCCKALQQYSKAADILLRVAKDYEDFYQISLCYYLGDDYAKSLEVVATAEMLFDTIKEDIVLIKLLAQNELQDYDNAKLTAKTLNTLHVKSVNEDLTPLIDSLYAQLPKKKSERVAEILSFIPGLGQIYAGEYLQGLAALGLNAVALGFGVWQIFDKCYITAYVGGVGGLSMVYPGARTSGVNSVKKYNYRQFQQFNTQFKTILIDNL